MLFCPKTSISQNERLQLASLMIDSLKLVLLSSFSNLKFQTSSIQAALLHYNTGWANIKGSLYKSPNSLEPQNKDGHFLK